MNRYNALIALLSLTISVLNAGQISSSKSERKYLFGFSLNNSWSNISGENLPQTYFYKPSLGAHLKGEYYIKPFIGLGLATGFQQRGAGVQSSDFDQSLGNPDSTHRLRIRFNTLDFPFYLILRTPKEVFKGVKLHLQVGGNVHRNVKSTRIFYSLEDGFHNRTDASADYYKNSGISLHTALGVDINAGSNTFQVQLTYNPGRNNVYSTSGALRTFTGKNSLFGIQLGFLY